MKYMRRIAQASVVLGLLSLVSACIVAGPREGYREGYYDHEHARYYHEHAWHSCGEHDDHCR